LKGILNPMRKLPLLCFALVLICPILPAQQTLDNDAVVRLAESGLSDDLLIAKIKASPGNYDISMYALDVLRKKGFSEKVLAAIVEKASGYRARPKPSSQTAGSARSPAGAGSGKTASAAPAYSTTGPSGRPDDKNDAGVSSVVPKASGTSEPTASTSVTAESTGTSAGIGSGEAASALPSSLSTEPIGMPVGISNAGVYYKDKSGAWIAMLPETVNFESTEKLRNIASAGIMKGDLDGRIEGAHARVDATLPVIFAVYLPETARITDYVLLELHPAPGARTFLSAEGGALHTQPGAHRDEIDFQPEKLAPRLYQITLPAIEGNGEYGLLDLGAKITSNKETTARIYTVSVAQ
jgi:hypothetical protein